jgi:hypothetical protein
MPYTIKYKPTETTVGEFYSIAKMLESYAGRLDTVKNNVGTFSGLGNFKSGIASRSSSVYNVAKAVVVYGEALDEARISYLIAEQKAYQLLSGDTSFNVGDGVRAVTAPTIGGSSTSWWDKMIGGIRDAISGIIAVGIGAVNAISGTITSWFDKLREWLGTLFNPKPVSTPSQPPTHEPTPELSQEPTPQQNPEPEPEPAPPPSQPLPGDDPQRKTVNMPGLNYDADGRYAIDSITVNGKTINAYVDKKIVDDYYNNGKLYLGVLDPGDGHIYNNCAELVSRFYRELYGMDVANLFPGETPSGGVVRTSTPSVGDIVSFSNHWALVKSVNADGTLTLIEQNFAWANVENGPIETIQVNRVIQPNEALAFYTKP